LKQLDKPLLGNLKCLKCVAKFGVGFFILDVKAANEYGIKVWWTGRVSKRSVSEQTLGFMLGLSRNLFGSGYQLKPGSWNKKGGGDHNSRENVL